MLLLPIELINIIYKNLYYIKYRLVLNELLNCEHKIFPSGNTNYYGIRINGYFRTGGLWLVNTVNNEVNKKINLFKGREIKEINGINMESIKPKEFKTFLKKFENIDKYPYLTLKFKPFENKINIRNIMQ